MSEKEETNKIPIYADPALIEKDKPPVPPTPPIDPKRDYLTILQEKLDKIIDAINAKEAQIAHHLDRIATALEAIANKPSSMGVSPTTPKPPATPTLPPSTGNYTDEIKLLFPNDLQEMLTFTAEGTNTIIIKPKRFLGSDNFAKIASIVRNAGGEYISAGKESHFKVTKQ